MISPPQTHTRGTNRLPPGAIRLTSHAQLAGFAAGFAAGRHRLLITLGAPGVGKSHAFHAALLDQPHLTLRGHVTPRGLYRACFEGRDRPLVLDDIDGIVSDPVNLRLLKMLLDSGPTRRLSWRSGAAGGTSADGVPAEFETRSPVALIANDWPSLSANVRALEDRGLVIAFVPGPREIHRHVSRWFEDREVLDFIGEHLPLLRHLSMRTYLRGSELRSTTDQWRPLLLESLGVRREERAVVEIRSDPNFATEGERAAEFRRRSGASRATYFRVKGRLRPAHAGTAP